MSNPAILKTFDPFATHPFTNVNAPAPAKDTSQPNSAPIINNRAPVQLQTPQPKKPTNGNTSQNFKPIFVPFQHDRASPDLPVMKKGSSSQWSKS